MESLSAAPAPSLAEELSGLGSAHPALALVGHVEVKMAAEIGSLTLSIEQLLAMKAGDQLKLDQTLDAPVSLLLNGRLVAHAELMAVDDHYAIRILELL
ncbi:FliM/FliN family flagellar motor C-terminal domain-containing protein [Stenotrophomonas ginsengisoli]|uniref:FliM/FliN family flagellar motor C-terminal domain-containing protein n=1 Tax=Stenotrophomonas ginsengisoli TaxID=336566 RepID=UPI00070D8C4C|nr:FliM/FliN family flagellar motor C-terminal domain-containing protein [Stenotrophomonas ginsengisoli]